MKKKFRLFTVSAEGEICKLTIHDTHEDASKALEYLKSCLSRDDRDMRYYIAEEFGCSIR